MARPQNYSVYSKDSDFLSRVAEEYESLGREVRRDSAAGRIVILAMPTSYKRKRLAEKKLEANRRAREAYNDDEVYAYDEE